MQRTVPDAKAGLSRFEASIEPPEVAPAELVPDPEKSDQTPPSYQATGPA